MSLPLWQPLRDAMSAEVRNAGDRAVTAFVTLALVVLALGFGVAAGLAALVPVMGFCPNLCPDAGPLTGMGRH